MAERELNIKVTVDSSGAVTSIKTLETEIENTEKTTSKLSQGFSKAQAAIVTINQAFQLASSAARTVVGAFNQLSEALDEAAKIEQITASFERFQEKLGRDSVQAMESLRESTGGLVSDLELLDLANTSAALGVDQGSDKFLELVDAAQKASLALGKDFGDAVAVINQGIGRLSPLILDNLGVVVKLEDAYKKYAEANNIAVDALTKQQQQEALLNETLEQLQGNFGETSKAIQTAGQASGLVSVEFANLKKEFLEGLSANEDLKEGLLALAKAMGEIDAKQLAKDVGSLVTVLADVARVTLPFAVKQFQNFNEGLAVTGTLIEQLKRGQFPSLELAIIETQAAYNRASVASQTFGDSLKQSKSPISDVARGMADLSGWLDETSKAEGKLNSEAPKATKAINEQTTSSKNKTKATKDLNKEIKQLSDLELLVANNAITAEEAIDRLFADAGGVGGGAGGFLSQAFGFEAGVGEQIGQDIADAIATGIQNGFTREQGSALIGEVGSSVGASLLEGTGFEAIGGLAGEAIFEGTFGAIADAFGGKSNAEANAREAFEGFLIDAFDAENAATVINGELVNLSDLVNFDRDFFDSDENGQGFSFFNSLGTQAQQAFAGVGLALSEIIGDPENLGAQFGAELATGFEGSLFALRGAIDILGLSFEDLGDAIEQSAKKGEISFLEAQSALQGLGTLAEDGVPGQIGAVTQAFNAMKDAGVKGGATTIQAFKAVGVELGELGADTIPEIQTALTDLGFSTEDVSKFMETLGEVGITSAQGIAEATDRLAIQALADLESQAFGFSETFRNQTDQLIEQLNSIPENIESNITLNVRTNAQDQGAEQAINSGALGEGLRA